jgi:glycosyltransferase involved in cell wall biosynthesis
MPLASVVIATYNRSSVLPYSIGSVLDQTVTELQILVIGDACTDDSERVVASMGDPRIEWVNQSERHGHQSGPNNEGIRRAEAPVIFYLGHDDLWFPHHVESLLEAFAEGADVAFSIVTRIAGDGAIGFVPAATPFVKGMSIPPTVIAHRKQLADSHGGWHDYRSTELPPEIDLLARYFDADATIKPVRRVTAVKFPASDRPNIYQSGDVREQAAWLERIRAQPTLDIKLMGRMLEDCQRRYGPKPLPQEVGRFMRTVRQRVAKRLRRRRYVPLERINRNKRRKGAE